MAGTIPTLLMKALIFPEKGHGNHVQVRNVLEHVAWGKKETGNAWFCLP
jgi:hypothetical protein